MPEVKPANKSTKSIKIADLPRSRSDRFVSIYANHTETTPGFNELAVMFSRIGKLRLGDFAIQEEVEVVLSWEHALRVRDLLTRMLDAYQKHEGKLRTQKEEDAHDPME
jgi:hypothetical protein